MKILSGKKIILGITASISAYKSPLILRDLIKLGADVTVIMTKDSSKFVSPLVLSNLSGKNVIIEQFDTNLNNNGAWHVKLANDCDLLVIAPLSANTISKIANGVCDNALLTVLFSLPIGYSPNGYSPNYKKIPVILSPAMDFDMWYHPIIKSNVAKLQEIGYAVIEPEEGELASGLIGKGRLPEISVIISEVINSLTNEKTYNNAIIIKNSDNILENNRNEQTLIIDIEPAKSDIEVKAENLKIENSTVENNEIIDNKPNIEYNILKSAPEQIVKKQVSKFDEIKSKIEQLEAKLNIKNTIFTTQDLLNKPIESINKTLENRKFDVELELELLKKKLK
ncbi:MAG: flavoprotein [Candidatus Kapaibacteriota bacterium]|jgi:hypothetical protein